MAWKKVLWVHQGYPDNYVPASFMGQLRRNRDVKTYSYWPVVQDSSLLVLNVALVQIFVSAFVGIYRGLIDAKVPCGAATVHSCVLFAVWSRSDHSKGVAYSLRNVALLTMVARALSPVFLSLTRAASSDSIWHIGAWLCLLYVVLASLPMNEQWHTRVMATNTALTATIVFSSRLATAEDVFYFLMFTMQTFVLLPSAGLWVHRMSSRLHRYLVMNACLTGCALSFWFLGPIICFAWVLAEVGIAFGIPYWFLASQKYKDQISGPWDPAKAVIDVK